MVGFFLVGVAQATPPEQRETPAVRSMKATDWMAQRRTKPVFTGAFKVGIVFVNFPDCETIDEAACLKRQTEGVTDYFKAYTQGVTWPEFAQYGSAYMAPHPRGYYLRHDGRSNRIGWLDEKEGARRHAALREAAIKHARKRGGRAAQVTAVAYASQVRCEAELAEIGVLREVYPEGGYSEAEHRDYPDQLFLYRPQIAWSEPLWPNSSIDLTAEGSAGTMIHELGHVLGAPDSYHKPEKNGGVPGTPVTLEGGPTAPLYCRWKHCAVLPKEAYRLVTGDTTLTLAPRWSTYTEGGAPLGIFIPTAHPNYLLHLEYEPASAKASVSGSEDGYGRVYRTNVVSGGIHIYTINICQTNAYSGHPDLVYTYRPKDPKLHGTVGGFATFREGDAFDENSDPANLLPNQLPTGVTLTFGEQTPEGATVTIQTPKQKIGGTALKKSLLPIVSLGEVNDAHPGSVAVEMEVDFRGEPLLTERGIVYGPAPKPTVQRGKVWRMEGIGYSKTRVTGLPAGNLYLRAYAKSPLGVTYSEEEQKVVIPRTAEETPPLLTSVYDDYNWHQRTPPAVPTLMRLIDYHRAMLDGKKPKKGEADLQRLHPVPTANRYPPTMEAFAALKQKVETLVETLGLDQTAFPEDFEKRLEKELKLPKRTRAGQEPVVALTDESSTDDFLPRLKSELAKGTVALLLRESSLTSTAQTLDACLIDGYRTGENGSPEVHVIFAFERDRLPITRRVTGWHSPDILLQNVPKTYLLFLSPTAKRR